MLQNATNKGPGQNKGNKDHHRGNRVSKAVIEARQLLIDSYVINGMSPSKIWQELNRLKEEQKIRPEKITVDLNFEFRTMNRYISMANKRIKEASLHKRKYLINRRILRLDDIYSEDRKSVV